PLIRWSPFMARNRNETQFDDYREWQWIKHLILRDYAYVWARILGSAYPHLIAVDACAGAGSYTNPDTGETMADGSAPILGRVAKAYTEERGPGKSMHLICCERNMHNYASLLRAVQRFQPHVTTLAGSFHRHVPAIMEELGNSPALVLLDPIGVATIPAHKWRPLLERKGKTDLFIVLHMAGVHRVGGWLTAKGEPNPDIAPARRGVAMMDRVFNGRRWREIAVDPALAGKKYREERERRYLELFYEDVIASRMKFKCCCEVRAVHDGRVKYWFVLASGDFKAYQLMNDEIVKVNEILLGREYGGEGTIEGFARTDLEAQRAHVEGQMLKFVVELLRGVPGGTLPEGVIEEKLLSRFFGRAKSNVPWRVIKGLCKSDRLEREKNKAAAADPLEMISLPTPPDTEGGAVVPIRRVA
ncbi:MAG TPA: three-Cys-motif partner protein TcmP, partial [Burkholderiales bacterium]|nr:three-Cys-motif partner protein TcmP [Burkholderiales bacterium]